MTELRQKMIRAMDLKNFTSETQRSYLTSVNGLARHYGCSPEQITDTMIEDYLLYLKNEKGNALSTCCTVLTAVRFFYAHILDKHISIGFSMSKTPQRLPTVLSMEEVWKLICAPANRARCSPRARSNLAIWCCSPKS